MTHCEKSGCPRIATVEVNAQSGMDGWLYGYFCRQHAEELEQGGIALKIGDEI